MAFRRTDGYRTHGLRCLDGMCLGCLIYELAEECERDNLWLVRQHDDGTVYSRSAAPLLRDLLKRGKDDN